MDPELDAMQKAAAAMADLDSEGKLRVILWLISRFGLDVAVARGRTRGGEPTDTEVQSRVTTDSGFADVFFKVDPQGHAQRALVAAYWLAGRTGESFGGQAINGLLKDLGFQIPNITDALSQNMREKPALVIQTRKSGSSQQARKQYKITEAGIRNIEKLILAKSANEES